MQGARYSSTVQSEFSTVLNQRVRSYFKEHGIDPHGSQTMFLKSILLFGLYAAVYLFILLSGVSNLPVLFFLWALLGILLSFIGMAIMHDTVHGAYTNKRALNYILQIPILAIGVEPKIWRIEHNVLHHTYPNVEGIDQDIHPRFVFRFTKHQKRRWYHAYQHIYATFIYGLLIIEWMTVKDFMKVIKYHRMGFFKSRGETFFRAGIILLKKLLFYFLFLYLPLKILPFNPLLVVLMFLTMLVVAGIFMTIVFQLAHVVSDCETEGNAENLATKNWHVYQLETTCDFAHENKVVSYLIGGLNYQIEHHLFPGICHVHYPEISVIVKQTAREFGIRYHYQKTFTGAVKAHYNQLKNLGKKQ
ncbi:MAG: fatty acid desaturase family protein [Fluviicola sp.]